MLHITNMSYLQKPDGPRLYLLMLKKKKKLNIQLNGVPCGPLKTL